MLYTIPVLAIAVGIMVLEARWAARHPEARGYERRDTLASVSMGALKVSVGAVAKLGSLPLFMLLYEHRVLDLGQPALWWSWIVLLLAEDACFYWFHRTHHEVRLLWAAHVNHHSSRRYNLSTAWRQTLLTTTTRCACCSTR